MAVWQKLGFLLVGGALAGGCGQGLDTARTLGHEHHLLTLYPADATAVDAAAVISADGRAVGLAPDSAVALHSCSATPSGVTIASGNDVFAFPFVSPDSFDMPAVSFSFSIAGSPNGSLWVTVHRGDVDEPSIATSSSVSIAGMSGGMNAFSFAPAVRVEAGQALYFQLHLSAGGPYDGSNYVDFWYVGSSHCGSEFGAYLTSSDGAAVFNPGPGGKGVTSLGAVTFNTTGPTLTYVFDVGRRVRWLPATFAARDNPGGETGVVDFEVQAGDQDTPTFMEVYESEDGVRRQPSVEARYLHVRARLTPGAPLNTGQAVLGEISMGYEEI